jgi:hypothetical protein
MELYLKPSFLNPGGTELKLRKLRTLGEAEEPELSIQLQAPQQVAPPSRAGQGFLCSPSVPAPTRKGT